MQRYIQKLKKEKEQLLIDIINSGNNNSEKLKEIEDKIFDSNKKLEMLLDVNN